MKKLYKYVKPERIDVLKKLQIRFTQPVYLNDPFDSVVSFKSVIDRETANQKFDSEKMFYNFIKTFNLELSKQVIQRNVNLSITIEDLLDREGKNISDLRNIFDLSIRPLINLFSTNNEEIRKIFRNGFNSFLGVLSLTETPDNIPMWAHYSNVHQGFVLIFNKDDDFFNSGLIADRDFGIVKKVDYKNQKTLFPTLKDFKGLTFFEKHISWKYEKEWRMLLPLELAHNVINQNIFLFNFPPSALVGIIFGFRSNQELKNDIRELLNSNFELNHLELFDAFPETDTYTMRIQKCSR